MPTVSVVMSVYNGDRFLRQSVESILSQSYRDFEFIIIDDGSKDRSSEILEEYRLKDSRVVVLGQENRGLIESLNRGCELARGRYIARMDADDVAVENRLELQVAFLNGHPQVGLLGGAAKIIDVEGRILRSTANPCNDPEIRTALIDDCPFWHPTVMLRKDIFHISGGYRKIVTHAEDYDLWLRIAELCEMANLKAVLVAYRLHSNQVTTQQCRGMVMSTLVARSAAARRRELGLDPLDSAATITPSLLVELGISETELEAALAARFVYVIRNMYSIGEFTAALQIVAELRASERWQYAGKRVRADFYLLAAGLYWKHGRIKDSLSSLAEAVLARPAILGRPMLPLFDRLRKNPRQVTPAHTCAL